MDGTCRQRHRGHPHVDTVGPRTCSSLLSFVVTLLGRLPVVTPTWAYPAVFFLAGGVLLWPPVLAVLVGRMRWRASPTALPPARRCCPWSSPDCLPTWRRLTRPSAPCHARRCSSRTACAMPRTGNWPATSPGSTSPSGGPTNVAWQVAERSSVPGSEIDPEGAPVPRQRAATSRRPVPATITATIVRRPGDADVEITVTPRDAEWQAVAIVLPESIVPTRSTLAGRTQGWALAGLAHDDAERRHHVAGHCSGKPGRSTRGHRGLGCAGAPARCRRRRARAGVAARATHGVDDAARRDAADSPSTSRTEAPAPMTPLPLPLPSATPSVAAPLPPATTPSGRVPR